MQEWLQRQQELHTGEITREEYFDWPQTRDDCGKHEPEIQWRKGEAES